MAGKVKDITGNKYSRWTVVAFDRIHGKHGARFHCKCSCGTLRSVFAKTLKQKRSRSCGCTQKLPKGEAARNSIFRIYRRGAKKRGLLFEITLDQFDALAQSDCYYCGNKPVQCHKNIARHYNGAYTYNGIDRLDNDIGYLQTNCVPCCGTCNMMKRTMVESTFVEQCRKIAANRASL